MHAPAEVVLFDYNGSLISSYYKQNDTNQWEATEHSQQVIELSAIDARQKWSRYFVREAVIQNYDKHLRCKRSHVSL